MGKYSTRAPNRKLGTSVGDDPHHWMDIEADIFMYLRLQRSLILLTIYLGIRYIVFNSFYIISESLAGELGAQILSLLKQSLP